MRAEELLAAALRGDAVPWPADLGAAREALLIDAAREQGVAALLTATRAIQHWPDHVQRAFHDMRRGEAVVEVVRRDMLQRLLAAFDQAGVRCLVMKGAQLAYTHYPAPWLRPRADADLLVAPADRERADAVLRAFGYLPGTQISGSLVAHQLPYQRRDQFGLSDAIDLHWKIANPHLFADALTFDELMAAACPIATLGEAQGLSAMHALMLACVHRVAHHQNADLLIWLYDIHLLARRMDATEREAFVELARAKRLRSICAAGLDGARRRFANAHDARWWDRLDAGTAEAEPSAAFLRDGVRRVDILRADLRAVGGWTRKARLLQELVFPPAAYVRAQYGHDTPLLFAYVSRMVTGVGKWFRPAS